MAELPSSSSCRVAIVLDQCGDASWAIADGWGARFGALVVSPGMRERGNGSPSRQPCPSVSLAQRGARVIWSVTTDADSRVPRDWLAVQLDAYLSGADMWAGRSELPRKVRWRCGGRKRYSAERDPVHGASLGFSLGPSTRSLEALAACAAGEDRDLHHRAVWAGFQIAYDLRTFVTTSSRRKGRAPGCLAGVLDEVDREELGAIA